MYYILISILGYKVGQKRERVNLEDQIRWSIFNLEFIEVMILNYIYLMQINL